MPILINEIEISVTVSDNPSSGSSSAVDQSSSSKEEIIKECVEQVMEILNQKNQR
ncbi:hypothetical protein ADIARSV_2351 [Arcticibacter svalbardensis MN12-7]|uniref:Uncharacterized protein n=1 Tax=Arcticibacter svalbardensis MN12-7 TaxID=1150600 RepID=R9GSG8_9SPHI|nr:DUF5908 family protein [Arcticibacter svalbardensis]EOR94505.1 hypothetical protein ADIARSV_2351 [Arcticibacter svalbardensis MN12-7]